MGEFNPIKSVAPVDVSGVPLGLAVTTLPAPAAFKYALKDISGTGAGRTEDLEMIKKRKGQSTTIELNWKMVSLEIAAAILQAFNPEYVAVEYLDAKAGGWLTKIFYVGDRNSPIYNSQLGYWESISFSIIQKGADPG